MTKCYEHEECEYNGQPECHLPDGVPCPHGVTADKPAAESGTDIEALIERLNQYSQSLIACQMGGEFSDVCMEAAEALSTLQAENEKLRAELEQVREDNKKLYSAMMTIRRSESSERMCVEYRLDYCTALSHQETEDLARIVFEGLMREDARMRSPQKED